MITDKQEISNVIHPNPWHSLQGKYKSEFRDKVGQINKGHMWAVDFSYIYFWFPFSWNLFVGTTGDTGMITQLL